MARYAVIDFGSHAFKAYLVNSQANHISIEHQFYELNPFHNYDWMQEEKLLPRMKTWLDKNADLIAPYTVIATVPGFFVFSRLFSFPFGRTKHLESVASMELDEQLPFSHEELILDFKPYISTKTETQLIASGIPKEPLRRFLEVFKAIDQDPPLVTYDASVHTGLFTLPELSESEVVGILDLGHRKSTFSIHYHGTPCFTRTMMVGGHTVSAALSEKLGIPIEKSEEIKKSELVLPAEGIQLSATQKTLFAHVESALEKFGQQIQFSLLHFEMRTRLKVSKIYLMGGTAKLQNIAGYLSAHFPYVSFELITSLGPRNLSFDELEWSECYCAVLSQNKKVKRNVVNFRRGEFSYRKNWEEIRKRGKQIVIAAAILLSFPLTDELLKFALFKSQYENLHKQLVSSVYRNFPELEQQLKRGKSKAVTSKKLYEAMAQTRSQLESKLNQIDQIEKGVSALTLLKSLSETIPQDNTIDVYDLSITPGKIRINAATDSVGTRDRIVENLQKHPNFAKVIPGPISNCTEGSCKKFVVDIEVSDTPTQEKS